MDSNKNINFLIGIIIFLTIVELPFFFVDGKDESEDNYHSSFNIYNHEKNYGNKNSFESFDSSSDNNSSNNVKENKYEGSEIDNSYDVFNKEVATGDPYYIFDRVDEIMSVKPKGDSTKDLIEFFGLLLQSLDNTYSEFLTLVAENDSVKDEYLNKFKDARESFAIDNQTEDTGSSGTLNYLLDETLFTLNDLSRNVEIQTGGPLDLDKYGVEKFDTSKYVKANIPYFDFSNDEEIKEENNSNQESPYVKGHQLIVTGEKANIREEPSLEAKVVGYWIKEDVVTVYDYIFYEERWWIKTDHDKEWWVSERNLKVIDK